MNRWGLLAIALTIIAAGSTVMLVLIPAPKTPLEVASSTPTTSTSTGATTSLQMPGIPDLITVDTVTEGQPIASPLTVEGSARGMWYFEASFPVVLTDEAGTILAQVPAQAQSDWMTTDFVHFKATLSFPVQTPGSRGYLILKKDNPSGDPSRDQSVKIPILFE